MQAVSASISKALDGSCRASSCRPPSCRCLPRSSQARRDETAEQSSRWLRKLPYARPRGRRPALGLLPRSPMLALGHYRGAFMGHSKGIVSQIEYRPDIDGLRAVAVLLIVLFHLGLYPPGGFVGVDVFFVISGFLITTIILRDIEVGRFSFAAFYARRMRRILPALLVMLIVALGAGAFLLMPGDYEATGRSALYAAGSLSNFYFFNHTGY